MSSVKIAENIFWVGAIDWNMRTFHGFTYTTKRGTTYNSYLILDKKNVIVDAVHAPFTAEMVKNIKEIIHPEKIDFIIANHVEVDHSGALPALLRLCTNAKIVCDAKCADGLKKYYHEDWDFQIVKTGDKLSIGSRTLTFLEAPMLHWPDSMFTYVVEDQILMPNDAFGQHYASSRRFDDEVEEFILMEEAAKYYANILWPLSSMVHRKIEEVKKLNIPVKMIAPSHGIIWRKDPAKILNAYLYWSENKTKEKVVMAYETMWGSTAKMAQRIADGIASRGIKVDVYDVNLSDRTEVITEMLDAKGYMFGSSTHGNDMLSTMAAFLHFLKGLKPKNRIGGVFGSYGWGGGAITSIEKILKESEISLVQNSLGIRYNPTEEELRRCFDFGVNFANAMTKNEEVSDGKVSVHSV